MQETRTRVEDDQDTLNTEERAGHQDHINNDADKFFQEISADVPLKQLRKIVNSAYFDEDLRFCGLLSEIVDDRLKHYLHANFLLEIWCDGELVFTLPL